MILIFVLFSFWRRAGRALGWVGIWVGWWLGVDVRCGARDGVYA